MQLLLHTQRGFEGHGQIGHGAGGARRGFFSGELHVGAARIGDMGPRQRQAHRVQLSCAAPHGSSKGHPGTWADGREQQQRGLLIREQQVAGVNQRAPSLQTKNCCT
jgi:hypothetical protein